MASPCLVLLEPAVEFEQAQSLMEYLAQEVFRIQQKYSRYQTDSVLSQINQKSGQNTAIDTETYQLLQMAQVLWQLSKGRFDCTSGVLRPVWRFHEPSTLPTQEQIDELLPLIGWQQVELTHSMFTMHKGMQLDLGGLGKEYAADRCAYLARERGFQHCLINLGGDIATSGTRANHEPWQIGIENANELGQVWQTVPLLQGGMATSGTSFRFIEVAGKRYSHILDALTGWALTDLPRSITVAAPNCTEAGALSTLAMLQGDKADEFLQQSTRPYWVQW
jgi:thiamine biosynthesis lipoprotein